MKRTTTCRGFVRSALAGTGGALVLPAGTALGYRANERLRLAVVGMAGASHIYNAEVVAFCTPDQRIIPRVLKQWEDQARRMAELKAPEQQRIAQRYGRMGRGEGVKFFADVRRLFGEMVDQVDALVVSDTLGLRELWDTADIQIHVQAECSRTNGISFPRWERVRWEVPARKDMPPVQITWHHGPEFAPDARRLIHDKLRQFGVMRPEDADALMQSAGSLLVGSEGALAASDHSTEVTALPKDRFAKIETSRPQRIAGSQGLYKDWTDACRGARLPIMASFDNGGPLSEILMLGNIATQFSGQTLCYDPAAGQITNHAEANQKTEWTYREGWRM